MKRKHKTFLEIAKDKTKEFWHSYLLEDTQEWIEMLLSSTVVMGMNGESILHSNADSKKVELLSQKIFSQTSGALKDEWYKAQIVTENVCIVYGTLTADEKMCFSMIWHEKENEISLYHLHHSFSQSEQEFSYVLMMQENEIIKQYRELVRRSQMDMLTGVYIREFMEGLVNDTFQNDMPGCAFVMIDLDNFKSVNDGFGHVFGDYFLARFAQILKDAFEKTGRVARIGGDEFCVFINNSLSKQEVKTELEKFLNLLDMENQKEGKIKLRCTAGVSFLDDSCKTFVDLYDRADKALYLAKSKKKGSYMIYTPPFVKLEKDKEKK